MESEIFFVWLPAMYHYTPESLLYYPVSVISSTLCIVSCHFVPLLSYSLWFLAISCLASRALAGTRSSPVSSVLICTRGTSLLSAQRASRRSVTACGLISSSTYTTETENRFVSAVCPSSISSVNQNVARPTCSTGCCCIRRSSSTRWRSRTGGPGNALVSHEEMGAFVEVFHDFGKGLWKLADVLKDSYDWIHPKERNRCLVWKKSCHD